MSTEHTSQARIHDDRPSEQPASVTRSRRPAPAAASSSAAAAPAPQAAAPVPVAAAPQAVARQAAPPQAAAPSGKQARRLDPDQEAMLLMMKVMERAEVARSFAKLATGLLTVTAARATVQLRAVADQKMADAIEREGGLRSRYGGLMKIARAAKEAAVHVATHRPTREDGGIPGQDGTGDVDESDDGGPDTVAAPETQEAPPTGA